MKSAIINVLCSLAVIFIVAFLDMLTRENSLVGMGLGSYVLRMVGLFTVFRIISEATNGIE